MKRIKVADLEVGMRVPRWVLACEACGAMFMGYQGAAHCSDACGKGESRKGASAGAALADAISRVPVAR